ncbi:PLP-dependent transferase [Roseibium sp. M-1]
MTKNWKPASYLVHHDRLTRNIASGALFEQRCESTAFEFNDTEALEDVYQGRRNAPGYGRQGNPTVEALESRVNLLEDGVGTIVFSTGMAAYDGVFSTLLSSGDHIVASKHLFSNTISLLTTMKERWGIQLDFVDATDAKNVRSHIQPNTVAVLVETIANPGTQIPDLEAIGVMCRESGIVYIVDNTVTTPIGFSPKTVGASLVINSLTKAIAGHGRSLGGSVTDTGLIDWLDCRAKIEPEFRGRGSLAYVAQLKKRGRSNKGSMMSSSDAFLISMGMETFPLRVDRSCSTAVKIAQFLADHPCVDGVSYPGLSGHPQNDRAKTLFSNAGALLTFNLNNIRPSLVLDRLSLIVTCSSLGDTRTLAIPPASTIFSDLGSESRREMQISDTAIRLSVGLEDPDDLIRDLEDAFSNCSS